MILKRIYDRQADKSQWVPQYRDASGRITDDPRQVVSTVLQPPVVGVKVVYAGMQQHFTPEIVERGTVEGWLSLGQGRITIHGQDGPVVYRIVRTPGWYCCYCGAVIPDASAIGPDGQTLGRHHVQGIHGDEGASPDPQNPSGYCRVNAYECVRETKGEMDPGLWARLRRAWHG